MKTSDFWYDLPKELIAQDPLEDRASSRLMVLDRRTGKVEHHVFREIADYLNPGDCLVINNTKVIPARLIGVKEDTGAAVEVLLLKRLPGRESEWETLVKPGKKCRPGARLSFGDGLLTGEVTEIVDDGNRYVRFEYDGVLRKYWTVWDRCRCPLISPMRCRTGTATRPYTQSMTGPRRLLRQGSILPGSSLTRSGRRE